MLYVWSFSILYGRSAITIGGQGTIVDLLEYSSVAFEMSEPPPVGGARPKTNAEKRRDREEYLRRVRNICYATGSSYFSCLRFQHNITKPCAICANGIILGPEGLEAKSRNLDDKVDFRVLKV